MVFCNCLFSLTQQFSGGLRETQFDVVNTREREREREHVSVTREQIQRLVVSSVSTSGSLIQKLQNKPIKCGMVLYFLYKYYCSCEAPSIFLNDQLSDSWPSGNVDDANDLEPSTLWTLSTVLC